MPIKYIFSWLILYKVELACDIPKQSKKIIIENKIKDKFTKLNLQSISSLNNFLNNIKKDKYIKTTNLLLSQYFQDVQRDMSEAILMAYCISLFSNELFNTYKSRFEQKLILAANKTVLEINKLLINSDSPSELYHVIDHYISLYKVWKSQDSIDKLSKVFEEIQNNIKVMNIQKNKGIKINISKSKELFDKLFIQNPKYAIRILLHNYKIFNNFNDLEEYFWDCVQTVFLKYFDTIFITLISELKILVIPLLMNPYDRKNIYYTIDTEELIQKISNSCLTHNDISYIINEFNNNIKKINSNFIFDSIVVDKFDIIKSFKLFYHETLK
ncbi:hypothetical protein Indivirus_1_129 [Indivirus ILV1]|uniref:Uncharacterized protein n=1 Tax=Indivirus ILV1 TaxID=1977633 RepID=A0A1V0SCR7_9VIRU|nr:hypothetical protein Indivirus_1_129 [Indivirus ILV1]